jgi:hypothetical protein
MHQHIILKLPELHRCTQFLYRTLSSLEFTFLYRSFELLNLEESLNCVKCTDLTNYDLFGLGEARAIDDLCLIQIVISL